MSVITGVLIASLLLCGLAGPTIAADGFTPPGPNVARGKSYALEPTPEYPYCTDAGDKTQLTDGVYAPREVSGKPAALWVCPECVGWRYQPSASITIDLGEDTPIAGLSLSTEAGGSEVAWPIAVLVAVSSDGRRFHLVDDLVRLAGKHGVTPDAGRHRLVTDSLRCHGRYLRLIAVASGPFVFSDEIEVYQGSVELLTFSLEGPVLDDVRTYLTTNQVPIAVRTWVARDVSRGRAELAASLVTGEAHDRCAAALDDADRDNSALIAPPGDDFRATLPLTNAHERLFRALGALRAAAGRPALELWTSNRWDVLTPWTQPTPRDGSSPSLNVRMMRNERRGETLNVSNNRPDPIRAKVWIEGLPDGTAPEWISLRRCLYVAQRTGTWDANALPEASRDDGRWDVTFPAGVAQQLWLAFHPGPGFDPGVYRCQVIIQPERGPRLQAPLTLTVESPVYPEEHTLALGMFDYTSGAGNYGITPGNLAAAVRQMQSYGYNVPWANAAVLSRPAAEDYDGNDRLIRKLDFTGLDAWVKSWPKAKYYAFYAYVPETMAGAAAGGEQFNRRVGAWMRAVANHLRETGVDPRRFLILLVDEPGGGKADEQQLHWSRAVKAAVPEFVIFCDPSNATPHTTGLRAMYEAADILCPYRAHYVDGGPVVQDFYEELRAGGRRLWLYSIGAGPARDPIGNMRAQSWLVWTMRGEGSLYWAYGDTGRFGRPDTVSAKANSWNTFAPTIELYSPVYLDATSITDSKSWLAYIEGAEDFECLHLLRVQVDKLEKQGQASPALQHAGALLKTLPSEILKAVREGDREATDRGRLLVLDALLPLR